jgi:4-hydroxythreonine-4-phosphate dehydrogenase
LHGIEVRSNYSRKINVLNLWRRLTLNFGVNDLKIGAYAVKSFVAATTALKEGW